MRGSCVSLAALPSEPPPAGGTPPSDREIVDGIARGEEWAADWLYDRVQPAVDRTLRRILRSTGPDYDDLVQTSFERIIAVLSERGLGCSCDLCAWSAAVAANIALDALRRRLRERRIFGRAAEPSTPLPAEVNLERRIEARSEITRIQSLLAKMKPKYAEAVLLHDVFGHDLSEVATLTGVSVAAAQSRVVRGRKELLRRSGVEERR